MNEETQSGWFAGFPVWSKVLSVFAAIAIAPFLGLAVFITVVLLAPFAIPALPVIALTLYTKERPAVRAVGTHRLPVRAQWVTT